MLPPAKQRRLELDRLQSAMSSPSEFAKLGVWNKEQKTLQMMIHRPHDNFDTHVSLYYHGFDQFTARCESLELDKDDAEFVMKMTCGMSQSHTSEGNRLACFTTFFNQYIENSDVGQMRTIEDMDGAIYFDNYCGIILEAKHEMGTASCDSYMEGCSYYLKSLSSDYSPAPCFIVELVGPRIAIHGAIYTSTICVDSLTSLLLFFQPNDRPAMEKIGRTFKALKEALVDLKHFYSSGYCSTFPFFCKFSRKEDMDGHESTIKYTEKIKNNVFRGTVDQQSVIVKFVDKQLQYGIDVHRFSAACGFAPELIHFETDVTSRYSVVVMDYVENTSTFNKHNRDSKCKSALERLHAKGFCHGDFRPNNVLVTNSGDIFIIDFDWSGEASVKKYPLFMNRTDVEWHATAYDGAVLLPAHDTHCLSTLF